MPVASLPTTPFRVNEPELLELVRSLFGNPLDMDFEGSGSKSNQDLILALVPLLLLRAPPMEPQTAETDVRAS